MIKLLKFENIYGIEKLNNISLINEDTIIYSPNGVMKSSFADGLETISNNENPKDIFNDIDGVYEIEYNDGVVNKVITDASPDKKMNLFVFRGEDLSKEIFLNPELANIVISSELKEQYEDKLSLINDKMDRIKEIVTLNILEGKLGAKTSETKYHNFMLQFGGKSLLERINNFLSRSHSKIKEDIREIKYENIFNIKTEQILTEADFAEQAKKYNELKEKKLNEIIFNNEFGISQLQDSHTNLIKNNYYKAGHKLLINDVQLDEQGVDTLIKNTIESVYESEEMLTIFNKVKSTLDKNADTRKLREELSKNSWLLEKLSNSQQFKIDFIFTKLDSFLGEMLSIRDEMEIIMKDISAIFEDAKKYVSTWDEVIKKYNLRFVNKYYEIKIKDKPNAVIGLEQPQFINVFKGTNDEISEEEFNRFSSGEKRAIYILYFLFEVERRKQLGEKFIIVADDIVDSFDYKNKYSMIEYLGELSSDSQIQIIILTHNFDFYRSCRHSFGSKLKSQLFAFLNQNGEVDLFDISSTDYESFNLIEKWKDEDDPLSLIALIPFLRNIIELKDGKNDPDYLKLTDYLHYNLTTGTIDLSNLSAIYGGFSIKCTSINNNTYFDVLLDEVKKMNSPISEIDLKSKTVLGIFIRVASDYYLLNEYRRLNNGCNPIIPPNSRWSNKLKNLVYPQLSARGKEIIDKSIVVAPPFAHVNSFMYEPLIDVGTETLFDVANELILINNL